MKIVVLGSGSAFSSRSRHNSCYYVEAGKEKFLLDCGSDAMRAMQDANVDFFAVDRIFITHMHADHSAGLPAVLTAMHVLERKRPLAVYIPFSQIGFARLWMANMFIYNERMSFGISLLPLHPGVLNLEDVELEFIKTQHLEKYSQYARSFGIDPLSFSVIVREGAKKFFFSSDLASLEEVKDRLDGGVSFIESTHPALDEVAALSEVKNAGVYFTHIPMELEDGGEWKSELEARFSIRDLNSVSDGQVIVL